MQKLSTLMYITLTLPKLTLDGGLKRLCNCDHDVGAENPKDVVNEEANQ